jgi:hypothetical protein
MTQFETFVFQMSVRESPLIVSLEWSNKEITADCRLTEPIRSFFAWIEIALQYGLDAFMLWELLPYWLCLTRINPDMMINLSLEFKE